MRSSNLLCTAISLILGEPALASDGVVDINQACAVQTGCFTGDTAGYPVTILAPGSYLLTSNLVVPDENTTGILVGVPSVRIDLNGFEIVRSGCEGATVSCIPTSGAGRGVEVAPSAPGVSVENGGVTGMGREGVVLGSQSIVAKLRVRWNGRDGIVVGTGSTVSGNVVFQNGQRGIFAGIVSVVSGNSAYNNATDGIYASSGSNVSSNAAYGNGASGIRSQSGVTVSGNTVRNNNGYGLDLFAQTTYRENTVTNNSTGTVFSGVNRGDNYCAGTGVVSEFCP